MDVSGDEYLKQLGLQSSDFKDSNFGVHFYHRGLEALTSDKTILILIHGYPQSAYLWRHIVKHLPPDTPLFIPDIPGYGQSSIIKFGPYDKRTVGLSLLTALRSVLPSSSTPAKVVIAGHDRGARIAHRLAVDIPPNHPTHNIILQGTILIDIVPTLEQFKSFSNPKISSGNFHWAFLPNVEIATALITAQGGSTWCRNCINRWCGSSSSGKASMASNNALEIYCNYFDNPEVVRASCEDYKAGANEDVNEQKTDQAEGKKIRGDTMVIYSKDYLGSRFDMQSVWENWVASEANLIVEGIGGGIGHFVCEESPIEVAAMMEKFFVDHSSS